MKKKNASKYIENKNKNIFNNLLINVSCHIHTLLFQKLPSCCITPTPAPKPESAPYLLKVFSFSINLTYDYLVNKFIIHKM